MCPLGATPGPLALHPHWDFTASPSDAHQTHPGATTGPAAIVAARRPLLRAVLFPGLQRKSAMSSERFSQLPATPSNYTSSVQKQEAAGAASSEINATAAQSE